MSEPAQALPEIDFATFILSLASSALVHLGELPEPDAPEGAPNAEPNLPLAKQSIEIIALLEQKTHGNLDDAERQLLQSVLYDLRVKFVDASKRAK